MWKLGAEFYVVEEIYDKSTYKGHKKHMPLQNDEI